MSPRLSPAGRAKLPEMAARARQVIGSACSVPGERETFLHDLPAADQTCSSFEDFAAKVIGLSLSPLKGSDEALWQVMSAFEDAGLFSGDELAVLDRETPSLRTNWGFHYPKEVRASSFADFFNARCAGDRAGEAMHIGVRRAFERLSEMFLFLRNIGNRAGFQHTCDLLLPAYRRRAAPGEVVSPGLNDNNPDFSGDW